METQARRQPLSPTKAGPQKEFVDNLPMPADLFHQLFHTLNERLADDDCDHSMRWTEEFLADNEVDTDAVVEWLAEEGGLCDCEVIANVEEKFIG